MRAKGICVCVVAVLGGICAAGYAQAQGQEAIRKKLEAEYQLTKTTADKTDIVTAGSVVVLQKDNLLMLAASSTNPCRNTYKDGKITQSGPCRANEKMKKVPGFLKGRIPGSSSVPDSPTSRTFVAGEKFWVTKIAVVDSGKDPGIAVDFFTDEIGDNKTRYGTTLLIPFGGSTPAPDEALKLVKEVITVAPAEDAKGDKQQAAPQGDQQQAPPAQNQPPANPPAAAPEAPPPPVEAPPPPVEAPPPPPPDPTTVSEGQTIDQVVAAMGQPLHKLKPSATKEIYVYKDVKITFINGKVKDIQ
ncbi:MAG: hypothetical protein ACLP59_22240 [Bryobacteraceae bacterium]